ncbi:MAG TPA: YkgJ family cysteine cluster protein [Allosphingosinicella sp.]
MSDNAAPAPIAPDASALCVSCGLCCNGVLFTNARAEPHEVPAVEAAGLAVSQVGERLQFALPCRHLDDGSCGIYEQRFTKCRTFRCALLKRLDSGEVRLDEAQATVTRAKQMVARVAALDPAAAQAATRAKQRAAGADGAPGADPAARRRLWTESLALDMFLDRMFRNRSMVRFPGRAAPDEGDR